jgi:hypothetical protein
MPIFAVDLLGPYTFGSNLWSYNRDPIGLLPNPCCACPRGDEQRGHSDVPRQTLSADSLGITPQEEGKQ